MKATSQCPFCGSAITPAQLKHLREEIARGQDPGILREMESMRDSIRSEEKKRAEIDVKAIRVKLQQYQKREQELDERDAEIKAREATIDTELRKQLVKREKEIREEEKKRAGLEVKAIKSKLDEYKKRELQLDEREAEIKARAATVDAEVRKQLAKREKSIREQVVSEMSEKQRYEVAERDEKILQLQHEMQKDKEARETEVNERLQEKEKQVRFEEKQRLEKSYEPLRSKVEEYRKQEAEFLKKEQTLVLREQEVELRVVKQVAQKREEFLKEARKQAEEKHGIELKENQEVIANLQVQLEEAQRTIQTGSAQRRGKIQEEELADVLGRLFPEDEIIRISSGVRGADVLQNVRSNTIRQAGSIYWESKRTKEFQLGWLHKLRQDQQEKKADVAALVTLALPDEVDGFSVMEGVVVLHPRVLEPVATLVREYLINIARQRLTLEQRGTKIQQLYAYMTGKDFLQRVVAIIDAQTRLTALNDKERKAHEKIWAVRDQLHQNIGKHVAQLYGDIEGIVGSLPPVEGLQLPPKPQELLPEAESE